MPINRRDVVVLILAVALVPSLAERLQSWLQEPLLDASTPPFLAGVPYWPLLVQWAVGVALFTVVGVALAALLRTRRVAWYALAFGVAYSLLRLITYSIHLSPVAGWVVVFLAYGSVFITPAVGAVLGAVLFRWLQSAFRRWPGHAA